MDLKSVLRELREEKGWSQRRLSIKTGVSNTEISRIESGERKKPDPTILQKFATALGVDYMILYKAAGYMDEEVAPLDNTFTEEEIKILHRAGKSEKDKKKIMKFIQEYFLDD